MKKVIITVFILSLLLLIGCQVPDDVPQAEVIEDVQTEDTPQAEVLDEVQAEETQGTEVPINKEVSSFTFEGYAPGKSQDGTFEEIEGFLLKEENNVVGMQGVIQAASVNTEIEGLDDHLKKDDFFDVEVYPTIEFISTSIENNQMSGTLIFHGVAKSVVFPVETTENSVSADFLLDTTDFNMKNAGVDKNVKITFRMSE
jgi:polyisoprenoid-binding protein YceI